MKRQNKISKNCENLQKVYCEYQKEKEEKNTRIDTEAVMTENFLKPMILSNIDLGSSENAKHEKQQKIYIQAYSIQMAQSQNKQTKNP